MNKHKGGFDPEKTREAFKGESGLPDFVARQVVKERIKAHISELTKKQRLDADYPYGSYFQEGEREREKGYYKSKHKGRTLIELLKTKKSGSDSPDRKGDEDYLKIYVTIHTRDDAIDSGQRFFDNHPFITGDKLYIRHGDHPLIRSWTTMSNHYSIQQHTVHQHFFDISMISLNFPDFFRIL